MKAAYFDKYNRATELELGDLPISKITSNEVLVKVIYAAVNPVDVMTIHGELKLILPHHCYEIAGNEMVEIVEKVGESVTDFKVGDRVFGRLPIGKNGSFAEFVAVDENALAKVPNSFSNEEAAAIPLAALTILQSLELMHPKKGATIFISGGTGSLGLIAKACGLKVLTRNR